MPDIVYSVQSTALRLWVTSCWSVDFFWPVRHFWIHLFSFLGVLEVVKMNRPDDRCYSDPRNSCLSWHLSQHNSRLCVAKESGFPASPATRHQAMSRGRDGNSLPFRDGLYHAFMVILGMVYDGLWHWLYHCIGGKIQHQLLRCSNKCTIP